MHHVLTLNDSVNPGNTVICTFKKTRRILFTGVNVLIVITEVLRFILKTDVTCIESTL
jgi:hypothetical protein